MSGYFASMVILARQTPVSAATPLDRFGPPRPPAPNAAFGPATGAAPTPEAAPTERPLPAPDFPRPPPSSRAPAAPVTDRAAPHAPEPPRDHLLNASTLDAAELAPSPPSAAAPEAAPKPGAPLPAPRWAHEIAPAALSGPAPPPLAAVADTAAQRPFREPFPTVQRPLPEFSPPTRWSVRESSTPAVSVADPPPFAASPRVEPPVPVRDVAAPAQPPVEAARSVASRPPAGPDPAPPRVEVHIGAVTLELAPEPAAESPARPAPLPRRAAPAYSRGIWSGNLSFARAYVRWR